MLSTMSSVTNTALIPDKNAECAAFAARYPRRDPRVFVAVRRSSAVGSPVARSLLIPHKVSSLRCGTLRGPRIHVVKMRRHSFAPRFQ